MSKSRMWQKLILFYIVQICLLVQLIFAGEVGDDCIPNEKSSEGSCVLATDCEVALRNVKQMDHHPFRRCGFNGMIEIVCCPKGEYQSPSPTTTAPSKIPPDTFVARNSGRDYNMSEKKPPRVADRECQKIMDSSPLDVHFHIIDGKNASQGEFPHMVALGYEKNGRYDFLCGGSVISKTFLLTAAHCVETLDFLKPSVARMGVIDIGDKNFNEKTDIKIIEIIKHPNYTRKTKYHDLALIRLEKPMQFSSNLTAICLYTSTIDPTVPLTVTGWGKISTTRDLRSDVLLKASVSVVAAEVCNGSYKWHKLPQGILNEQICAGDLKGKQDTCQGDSGGPLQALTGTDNYWRLVGVTSFGRGCGLSVPGVYSRISHYLDWIESVVWPN